MNFFCNLLSDYVGGAGPALTTSSDSKSSNGYIIAIIVLSVIVLVAVLAGIIAYMQNRVDKKNQNNSEARVTEPIHDGHYSEEEKKLIEDYRTLDFSGRKLVKQTVETLRASSEQSAQQDKRTS